MKPRNAILIVASVLLVILVFGCSTGSAVRNKPECNDKIDNDGDGKTDYPADTGCSSRNDKDESNCGDGVCEGTETCSSCQTDCGACQECNDLTDNDGDGKTDYPADAGCTSATDNDESNCGDAKCEGAETCSNCIADCGQCDSCSDSDNGHNWYTQGTVSGYKNNNPYSNTDFCFDADILNEYFCYGTDPRSENMSCSSLSGNLTYVCQNGACKQ